LWGTKFGDGGTPVVERFAFTTGQEARAGKSLSRATTRDSFPPPLPFCPPERSDFAPVRAQASVQKRFELRPVVAT